MNSLKKDLIRSIFIKSIMMSPYSSDDILINGLVYSEETKKIICTKYAEQEKKRYDDYKFAINNVARYNFQSHTIDISFNVGASSDVKIVFFKVPS